MLLDSAKKKMTKSSFAWEGNLSESIVSGMSMRAAGSAQMKKSFPPISTSSRGRPTPSFIQAVADNADHPQNAGGCYSQTIPISYRNTRCEDRWICVES